MSSSGGASGGGVSGPLVWAKVYRSAAYNVPSAAVTAIPWDAEESDATGFHDNVTNNTRLTVPTGQGGTYSVGYCLGTDANMVDAKRWITGILKNGADIRGARVDVMAAGLNGMSNVAETLVDLAPGDYIEAWIYQDTGSTKTLFLLHSAFWCRKVG